MIYVALPYSSPYQPTVELRTKICAKYCAILMIQGIHANSPVLAGHLMVAEIQMPSDFKMWGNYSFDMLNRSSELHVLQIPGWKESIGVGKEIEYATELGMKITYISEDEIFQLFEDYKHLSMGIRNTV